MHSKQETNARGGSELAMASSSAFSQAAFLPLQPGCSQCSAAASAKLLGTGTAIMGTTVPGMLRAWGTQCPSAPSCLGGPCSDKRAPRNCHGPLYSRDGFAHLEQGRSRHGEVRKGCFKCPSLLGRLS